MIKFYFTLSEIYDLRCNLSITDEAKNKRRVFLELQK